MHCMAKVTPFNFFSFPILYMKHCVSQFIGLFEKAMIQHYRGLKIRPDFQSNTFMKGIRHGE